jgi:hypothetical protein
MKATKVTEPGIYNIDINLYHQDKSWISSTGIKHFKNSPAEYRMYLDGYYDQDFKAHFDFGNSIELYLLDRQGFNEKVAVSRTSEWIEEALAENPKLKVPKSSKVYKELEAAFLKENEGKYIIPDTGDASFESLQVQCARIMADPFLSGFLKGVDYQSSCYWIDPVTGLQMKTRPDFVNPKKKMAVNMKTALDGSPEAHSKNMANLGYALQAGVEIEGIERSGLMPKVEQYFWLVLEKNAPFNIQLYEFNESDRLVIKDEYGAILSAIKRCKDADVWPGYGVNADNAFGILQAKLPLWYKSYGNE